MRIRCQISTDLPSAQALTTLGIELQLSVQQLSSAMEALMGLTSSCFAVSL